VANYYVSSRAYENITPWGGQRNMLLQSNSFTTTWTATNSTPSTPGTDADPDGGTSAWRLTDNATNAGHGISQSITKAAASLRYTFSVYLKAGPTLTRAALVIGDSASVAPTNGSRVIFDLTNGQPGVTGTAIGAGFTVQSYRLEPVTGRTGWFRGSLSVTSGTGTTLGFAIQTDNGTGIGVNAVSYVGSSNYISIYGAQLEPALHIAGTYTATTTTAVAQTVSFSATVGMIRRPTDPGADGFGTTPGIGVGAEKAYRCTTAGTAGAVEPSAANGNPWPSKAAATVTDGTAVWTEITGNESFQTAGSWAPYARTMTRLSNSVLQVNAISSFPAGGTGYAVNDILLITGVATAANYPVVKVSTVSAGAVTGVTILDNGLFGSGTTALATTKVTGAGSGATITLTTSTVTPLVNGDTIYLGNSHCEWAVGSTYTVTMPSTPALPLIFISVDQSATGHIPPTSADYLPGARIGPFVSGTNHSLNVGAEFYGITFHWGLPIGATGWQVGFNGQTWFDCAFFSASSSAGTLLATGTNGFTHWVNCTYKTSAANNNISPNHPFVWRNTASAIQGTTIPTALVTPTGGFTLLEGLDLTALAANKVAAVSTGGPIQLVRCKLGASTVVTTVGGTFNVSGLDNIQCDGSGLTLRNERYWTQGVMTTDTTVVRTGGATDGATAISWKVAMTTNVNVGLPFETIRSSIYNSTTGSSVNVNFYGVCNIAAPTTGDLWLDVDYLGTASSTFGSIVTQRPATRLTLTSTALTADTSAWDTAATARANTTAYAVGNVIKVGTNPGRIFICTTAGTSAGSEPGGYASAVDGGSVTDNTAIFRAGYRFKQTIAVTPQNAGLIHAMAKMATASTTALFWVDPQIVLS
jgi:hypothetical protein